MIEFVNAKINIGLQIVRRREDGYHDLQTVFYPIGLKGGTAENPTAFCDILEITKAAGAEEQRIRISLSGRQVDCPLEKNLVYKAASLYYEEFNPDFGVEICLDKHLPDGAGIGGGSADAAFTLKMLAAFQPKVPDESLHRLASRLGADCPFFLLNRPAYATGIGENLQEIQLDLSGKWLVLVKPDVYISTREAFAGVKPKPSCFDLKNLCNIDLNNWKTLVHNDFEDSIFPQFPILPTIKEDLYAVGASYASLTGSGSCLYGIFNNVSLAEDAVALFRKTATITAVYLLSL